MLVALLIVSLMQNVERKLFDFFAPYPLLFAELKIKFEAFVHYKGL